jgi:hypothetical protein
MIRRLSIHFLSLGILFPVCVHPQASFSGDIRLREQPEISENEILKNDLALRLRVGIKHTTPFSAIDARLATSPRSNSANTKLGRDNRIRPSGKLDIFLDRASFKLIPLKFLEFGGGRFDPLIRTTELQLDENVSLEGGYLLVHPLPKLQGLALYYQMALLDVQEEMEWQKGWLWHILQADYRTETFRAVLGYSKTTGDSSIKVGWTAVQGYAETKIGNGISLDIECILNLDSKDAGMGLRSSAKWDGTHEQLGPQALFMVASMQKEAFLSGLYDSDLRQTNGLGFQIGSKWLFPGRIALGAGLFTFEETGKWIQLFQGDINLSF